MVINFQKKGLVFAALWVIVFVFYIPAYKAGWVTDTLSWLNSLEYDSFLNYLNRSRFGLKSLYQFTQFNTLILYQLLGKNRMLWQLLFISLHAFNGFLIFVFSKNIFSISNQKYFYEMGFLVALLFVINPYHTEVVVNKACYHYLQGNLILFSILILLQKFINYPRFKYQLLILFLFFLSTFSHEFFYLTPFLVLTTILFYYWIGAIKSKIILRKKIAQIGLPIVIIFIFHFMIYFSFYGFRIAHFGNGILKYPASYFLLKPFDYLFHLAFWGRFCSELLKFEAYHLISSHWGFGTIFLSIVFCFIMLFLKAKRSLEFKLICYVAVCTMAAIFICMPLPFFEKLIVNYDRYTYLMISFWSILIIAILYTIKLKTIRFVLLIFMVSTNAILLIKTINKWKNSAQLLDTILPQIPCNTHHPILLLNSPLCYEGIPMLETTAPGDFKDLHNTIYQPFTSDSIINITSYNLKSNTDGVHVRVINDSLLKVSFNQNGSWWWQDWDTAKNYETPYFKFNINHVQEDYLLKLKSKLINGGVYFQSGNALKKVDLLKIGKDQW